MKSIRQIAGCLVIFAVACSGWAAEPQKDPATGGINPSLAPRSSLSEAGSVVRSPGRSAMVERGRTNVFGRTSPFSAEVSADFIKKVMETSAKIKEAKRQIAERQAQLYATNPEIKSARARMIAGQKEINRILDADQELAELKMSRDILWSTMPALPKARNPISLPQMPSNR